ncbi:MAG TPA: OmpA family protein [Rhodanobacteraceae bacterium]|nr:OmpA family protein [Rhodanobacteraceae bacterium]
MPSTMYRTLCLAVGMTAMVAFAGCSNYVKRSEFNAAIAKLQNTDQNLQQQIDSLSQDMKQHFANYDAQITAMQGRIRVDTVAHFAFNKADLQDKDKAMLDEFAKVMKQHHSDALVTVEGFTDPAGSVSYNKRLGKERAEAVRDYLVNQDGMSASQVRAVSYGESKDRQVKPGASGPSGELNRRVSLVIDFAGAANS